MAVIQQLIARVVVLQGQVPVVGQVRIILVSVPVVQQIDQKVAAIG